MNILAIVKSVEESNSGYEEAIKTLARVPYISAFTSEDIDISGTTLSWLARYGVLKVVGKKEGFICVDPCEETYKKITMNVYEIDCDIIALADSLEAERKDYKVRKIERRIENLKAQLAQALADLEAIE